MNILMTGVSGFLGGLLKKHYLDKGDNVITLGRKRSDDITIDFNNVDVDFIASKIEGIELIIHCAAVNEVEIKKNINVSYNVNVTFTRLLMDIMDNCNINNIIYISTFHVYGSDTGLINEKSKICPKNDYGLTHYLSEEIIKKCCEISGKNHLIVRPTNIYGVPFDLSSFNRWTLIPFSFTVSAFDEGLIIIKSSGVQKRNFVCVNDVIKSFDLIGKEKVVNVYGDLTCSIKEFAGKIKYIIEERFDFVVDIIVEGGKEKEAEGLFLSNTNSDFSPSKNSLQPFVINLIEKKLRSMKLS